MDIGLDELIESLLTELAFSGGRGYSVSALLKAIESFYNEAQSQVDVPAEAQPHQPGDVNSSSSIQQNAQGYDLSVASKVWKWLVARADVSVGPNRRFNHLTLDEILQLPEEEDDLPPTNDAGTSKDQAATPQADRKLPSKSRRVLESAAQQYRPRLYVSDERQWKTLTGHGPDLKRVPLYEWKALVDIASTKEKGILQGDLVRLTGQDKRSLPTRTDALAKKGYIIKQSVILRGCRSSKLWLSRFADNAKENRDGLNFDKVDLSKETLTKDLRPVPFSDSWNGERLDYIAIAQAFNAVIKAWGLMRYCDIRTKLDANRVPQMRALAKTSRWFTSIGAVTFVAARFANGQRLFKDCVKFIREPTAEEWRVFRTTPSAHIRVPSARLGKRGQASRARYNKKANPSPHSQAKPKRIPEEEPESQQPSQGQFEAASLWTPYKPMVNIAFEIIKRAGPRGSSNLEIVRSTLGYSYRKYIAALTGTLSLPNSQPPHLQHLNVTSQLNRIGRTMTYQFFADGEANSSPGEHGNEDKDENQGQNAARQALEGDIPQNGSVTSQSSHPFSQPPLARFAPVNASSLSQLHNSLQNPRPKGNRKRKRAMGDELEKNANEDDQARPNKIPKVVESPLAEARVGDKTSNDPETRPHGTSPEAVSAANSQQTTENSEQLAPPTPPTLPPPRPPGVYRERDNLLDPPGKKGRRKKSLVLTFKHNSLKSAFEGSRSGSLAGSMDTSSYQPQSPSGADPNLPQIAPEGSSTVVTETSAIQTNPAKRGRKTTYRCDKCGNSWKNSNGLEYHLKKSRTTCNPSYVPAPPPPPKLLEKPKPILKTKSMIPSVGQERDQAPDSSQRSNSGRRRPQGNLQTGSNRPLLPPKRIRDIEASAHSHDTSGSPRPDFSRQSIVLQDVEAYDIIEHRKRRENNQITNQMLLQTPESPSKNKERDMVRNMEVEKRHDLANTLRTPRKVIDNRALPPVRTGKADIHEKPEARTTSSRLPRKQAEDTNGAPTLSDFNLRPSSLKPTTAADGSTKVVAVNPRNSNTASYQTNDETTRQDQSTPKKPRRPPTLTVGSIRRDRTTQIIQHLLDENNGVFPGQRSLYLAVVSLWVKRHGDIEPPDWKVCQGVVNRMERAGTLVQQRFFFLDDKGKLQECCVLVNNQQGGLSIADLAADPKVVIVKEKMREMFPEPYIPEEFSLSQDESELFDALASKYRDVPRPNGARRPLRKSNVTEDIEVLQYPAHVMGAVSTSAVSSKRPAEDDALLNVPPTKKTRVDALDTEKPTKNPKARRRGEDREYWDTARVAKYIWNQKQNPGERRNDQAAHLQDFTTGTWSALPQAAPPPRPSIDAILSSLRTSRQSELASMRHLSGNKSEGLEISMENSTGSFEVVWNHTSQGDGIEETRGKLILDTTEKSEKVAANQFVEPSISTSFVPEDSASEEEDDDTMLLDTHNGSNAEESVSLPSDDSSRAFARNKTIQSTRTGCWPWLPLSFFETSSASFILSGAMPEARWFQRANLPQSARDITKSIRGKLQFNTWADPSYGRFLREVDIIERWEQSAEGSQILLHGSVAPDYIFIGLSSDISKSSMKPVTLEWPSSSQYTAESLPDDIKNASPEDEDAGLQIVHRNRGRPRREQDAEPQQKKQVNTKVKKPQRVVEPTPIPEPQIQYKTRTLQPIPIQHRGRASMPRPSEEKLGLSGETELIAAFVVFRTLLGGVDRKTDIGLILKTFPKFSHSALRKFWPKVSRERKTYIDALTEKFQSAFLEAYEAGEIAPINYDDIESYDWQSLIVWATKLETHDKVELPESRRDLEESFSLENVANEATDWRETWFHNLASIYSRVEATSSEPISIPLGRNVTAEEEVIGRARSWVRSLCVTPIRGADMPERIREKLLNLSGRNEAGTAELLKKVVDRLTSERVASRTKGKILGQSLRLHGVFAKHLQKPATVEKFVQSAKFKAQLDETFRKGEEFHLNYVADDGTIMAIFNLQASGRINVEAVDVPHIPFGFEPGNYDGRTFPKSYYHFNVKLAPTQRYIFDRDLPVLQQAGRTEIPQKGPRDEIPIWVDFFGNLDKGRWITYLSMTTLALATKGPLTPQTASVLLKPFVEPFEAKIIMDWINRLGLLQRFHSECSATVGEWWWLVVGRVALDVVGKGMGMSS